jgi:3',5'-cyclic AMP phosphodiesterase CpdA
MLAQTGGTRITRIAHISDVHALESRPGRSWEASYELSLRFLSFGRALDAQARARRFARSLDAAKQSGADHVVISGDLTEIGTPEQFEALAETLDASGITPERLTLVPGNHDAYTSPDAWQKAIEGPLRPWAAASAKEPGKVVETGGVVFMPIDTTMHQPITRSAGALTSDAAGWIARRVTDTAFRDRPLVLVQHHPPFAHRSRVWQWIDGLIGYAALMELLLRHCHVHALHGHLHHAVDRIVGFGKTQVFGAPAVVEDKDAARVRLYDVRGGLLEAA